jgi:hypothetical protein
MIIRNVGWAAAAFLLLTVLAGCGAAGTINTQQTGVSASVSAAAQSDVTIVVTRTVVVTSTVFATVSVGTSSATGTAALGTATSLTSSNTATLLTSSSTTAVSPSHAAHVTPTPAPGGLAIGDAATVTLAFLGALQKDPSGASSLPYLSTRLQAIVKSGHTIASLIGMQTMYTLYHADAAISRGGGRAATVLTTLTYGSGPIQRLFTLVPEAGAWHIDDIAATGA